MSLLILLIPTPYDPDRLLSFEPISGVASVSGTLKGKVSIKGDSFGIAGVTGTLRGKIAISSASNGVATVTGNVKFRPQLNGHISSPSPLIDGLVGYWKLDETSGNAIDSVNGNDGTLVGGVTQNVAGKLSNAYEFNGSTGQVSIGTSASLKPEQITVSAWVNLTSINGLTNIVFSSLSIVSSCYRGFAMRISTMGGLGFYLGANSTGSSFSDSLSTNLLVPGVWTHCVHTYDGNKLLTYIDGVLLKTNNIYKTIAFDTSSNVFIGGRSVEYFNGKLDEIGVWNRALAADEITALYNSGSGKEFESFSVSTVSGTLSGISAGGAIAGVTDGVASVSGLLKGKGGLTAVVNGTANNTGVIRAKGRLIAQSNGVALNSGTIRAKGRLTAASNGFATVGGTVHGHGKLISVVNGFASVTGNCRARTDTQRGIINGVATVTGVAHGNGKLSGFSSPLNASVTGVIKGKGKLLSVSNGVASSAGVIKGRAKIFGSSSSVTQSIGSIKGKGYFESASNGATYVSGSIQGKLAAQALANGYANVLGSFSGKGRLLSAIEIIISVSGYLRGFGGFNFTNEIITAELRNDDIECSLSEDSLKCEIFTHGLIICDILARDIDLTIKDVVLTMNINN
jgi:hypothetical protein